MQGSIGLSTDFCFLRTAWAGFLRSGSELIEGSKRRETGVATPE
jgi:hypothetical protein